MTTWIVLFVSAVLGMVGLRLWYRRWRRQRIAARRRVEMPNSYYASKGVQNQIDRHRWEGIRDMPLHPVNREEVDRLLDLVAALGVDALSGKERTFLDNMARLGNSGGRRRSGEGDHPDPTSKTTRPPGEQDPRPECA